MLTALGLGASGATLMALGTVTTNFVNIYLRPGLKSLFPARVGAPVHMVDRPSVPRCRCSRGRGLDRYADFMLVIGGLLVPVGGILLARFSSCAPS
jgi:purine-cytosine permease-like protein